MLQPCIRVKFMGVSTWRFEISYLPLVRYCLPSYRHIAADSRERSNHLACYKHSVFTDWRVRRLQSPLRSLQRPRLTNIGAIPLTEPGRDFTGGEFVLTEQTSCKKGGSRHCAKVGVTISFNWQSAPVAFSRPVRTGNWSTPYIKAWHVNACE